MPMYTYTCGGCGVSIEKIISISCRDARWMCPDCGGLMVRQGVERFRVGPPSYVPGAVLSNGSVVPGHFGKEARKKGGRYRP